MLLVIIALTLYNRNKIKQKANVLLAKQKLEIENANEELNQQNEEIAAQRDEIEKQRDLVEEHQKETLDSIHYAKRIQLLLFFCT